MSPTDITTQILFDCDNTCCVCRDPKAAPLHVHHIDGKRSNDAITNLAVLCNRCHADAHTKGRTGRILSPDVLRRHRSEWIAAVRENRLRSPWTELLSWSAPKGSRYTVKRVHSEPFTVKGPWRVLYGGRPSKRFHGHLKISVFRPKDSEPCIQVADIVDSTRSWWNRDGYVIKDTGEFTVGIHADADWWWARVEYLRQ
jgi:hypothetical protein